MANRRHQLAPHDPLGGVEVGPWPLGNGAIGANVEDTRQLLLEVLLKQGSGGLGGLLDTVAGFFVHGLGARYGVPDGMVS